MSIVGRYTGRWRVRGGKEDELTGAERKRFLKLKEEIPLDVRPDGTFVYKVSTEGTWNRKGDVVSFSPRKLDGHTLEDMREAAETQGRAFRLDFLFDPFELHLDGVNLVEPGTRLLYIEYVREV